MIDLEAEKARLLAAGHTKECAEFWADAAAADSIGERRDYWTQPACPACNTRRKKKGLA